MITKQVPSWYFPLLWSLLLFIIWKNRTKLYFPPDHPLASIRKKKIRYTSLLLCLLLFSYAYLSYVVYTEQQEYDHSPLHLYASNKQSIEVSGSVRTTIDQDGNRTRFDLLIHYINQSPLEHPQPVRVTHYANTKAELAAFKQVRQGDLFQGKLQVSYPQSARNPGSFDYKNFLRQQHIFFTGEIVEPYWESIKSMHLVDRLKVHLDHYRYKWINQTNAIFSTDVATIVQAMSVGYRKDLDSSLVEMYQQLGIIHILAISGLHVGIIIYCLYTVLIKLTFTKEKAIWIVWWLIPIYISISGAQASVVRAGFMALIALLLHRFNLWKHSLFILFLVYSLTLLYDPFYIYQIGFQLSYFVTFMLIVAFPFVFFWLKRYIPWIRINQVISISFIAQLASFPFLVYHFHQISPLSLVSNIFFVPVYSILLIPGGLILTLISFVHEDITQLGVYVYEQILNFIHVLLGFIYDLPFATIHFGQPANWWLLGYVCGAVVLLICLELQKWKASWFCLGILTIWIVVHLILPYLDHRAHIMVLDVGQGDSIVIELPYRREVVVIDVGGNYKFDREEWMKSKNEYEVGRNTVLPYLRYRGINYIDKLIFSHGHYDHIGGIQGILGKIRIKEVLKGPVLPVSNFEREWVHEIQKQRISIRALARGAQWGTKQAEFHVLFPEQETEWVETTDNPHDYNVVIWNRIYQHRFLWTGDVEEQGEREMLDYYPGLKTDILKVAHHGSKTSTIEEFLEQTQPMVGIISVGQNNLFGHPHKDIVSRLERSDMNLFRTDIHGGIYLIVSPGELRIAPTLHFSGK